MSIARSGWRPGTWSAIRIRLAGYSVAVAALTTAVVLAAPSGATLGVGASAYLAVVALAVFVPAVITIQVVAGQVLAGVLWLPGGDAATMGALLVIGSVVVTAELLAEVARLDSPLERRPTGTPARAGMAGAIAGLVFGLLALAGALPSVTGLVGVAVGVVVCVWVAVRMVRSA
ncbi:MAG: hypothetical protein HKN72_02315 [Gemmatimonadetes bacterium]|nr:hypothetical protein [Gemmatimonadota bacterium]